MRVLWVINSMLEEISEESGRKAGFGGGWIPAMSEFLREYDGVDLYITVFGKISQLKVVRKTNVTYCVFPYIKKLYTNGGGKIASKTWDEVLSICSPDVIHIYGTEQPTPIELIRKPLSMPVIISLQGIITEYFKHY